MDTVANLIRTLSTFELKQFDLARRVYTAFSPSCLSMCAGTAQFVVVQGPNVGNPTRIIDQEMDLPVICVVGSNYCQKAPVKHNRTMLQHFLNLTDPVIDNELYRGMRNTLDLSLAAHNRNSSAWTARQNSDDLPTKCEAYGSESALKGVSIGAFVRDDYILVISNLSPFITIVAWTKLNQRDDLLEAWKPEYHLDALVDLIGKQVDLWVGHGKTSVWERFWTWREPKQLNPWILTSNLSQWTLIDYRKAGIAPKNTDYPDPRYR
jgi:hypothetical protein